MAEGWHDEAVDRSRIALGAHGERLVAQWFCARGWEVLDANWRVRGGELDLVLGRPGEVVFCEVKTRSGSRFGTGFEAVGPAKRRRLRSLAAQWLATRRPTYQERVRIVVASVEGRTVEVVDLDW